MGDKMNKDEFEKKYDEVLKQLGFIHKREYETTAGNQKYIHLIYETNKRPGFQDPTEISFTFSKSNNEALEGIWLHIPVKNYPHQNYGFNSVEDLIYFLKKHKRGRGFNFDDVIVKWWEHE